MRLILPDLGAGYGPITPPDAVIGRYREPVEGTPFGRYQLIELLGRGGMGEVWRAHDTTIDRVVALKMLLPHYAKDEDFDKRFRREARTAARLDDPHVVPIYDVGEIDGRLYVTMRLINGVDLDTLLKTGPLNLARAVHIIEQIAGALHSAHQAGLVHRDVKPSNILLANNDFAYLIDFGIARAADDTKLTSEGSTIGTWAYMAPERFNTPGDIEPSSDIYALACVLFQCLTGEPPFPGNTLEQVAVGHMVAPPPRASELTESVPPGLDRVIETGLAKQTGERYSTAVDMAAAARRAITEPTSQQASVPTQLNPVPVSHSSPSWPQPPMQTPPPGHAPYMYPPTPPGQFSAPNLHMPPAPPAPKRKRHRGLLIGAAVFVVTLIVVGSVAAIVGLTQRGDSNAAKPPSAVGGADFNGTYRADLGPGTDLDGKPVPNAPATTSSWGVRSTCGAGGCMATAANISDGGVALLSNLTFDQIGGTWVAVGLASAQCGGDKPDELWVVYITAAAARRHTHRRNCPRLHQQRVCRQAHCEVHQNWRPRPQQGAGSIRPATEGGGSCRRAARQLSPDDNLHQRSGCSRQRNGSQYVLSSHRRSVHEPVPCRRRGRHIDVRDRQVDPQRAGRHHVRSRWYRADHHHRGVSGTTATRRSDRAAHRARNCNRRGGRGMHRRRRFRGGVPAHGRLAEQFDQCGLESVGQPPQVVHQLRA